MPDKEADKLTDLLQELHDLQTVLDTDGDDAIPVLSDVVDVSQAGDSDGATQQRVSVETADDADDNIPLLSSDMAAASADTSTVGATVNENSPESLTTAEEPSKPAPFSLVDSDACDYDSSAAESLIEEGLTEAVQPLTAQMDDAALRLVDELVAEHTELIRQQLKQRLAATSEKLRAESDSEPP